MGRSLCYIAINLLFADAILMHLTRYSPELKQFTSFILIVLGLIFSLSLMLPSALLRWKKSAISFPIVFLLSLHMLTFHWYYQAELFSIHNFEWVLLSMQEEVIGITMIVLFFNIYGLNRKTAL